MKKILPLLLAVMLIVCLVVPASATESQNLQAVTWNTSAAAVNFWWSVPDGTYPLNYVAYDTEWEYISVRRGIDGYLYVSSGADGKIGVSLVNVKESIKTFVDVLYIDMEQLNAYIGFDILFNTAVCDGSACPATDMNMDNVCDDCGMTFAVLRSYTLPDVYSVWTETLQESYPYAFIYYDDGGAPWLILSAGEPTYENGAVVVPSNYVAYNIWDVSWRKTSSYTDGRSFVTESVYSSFPMRDENGTIIFARDTDFFPQPLWEMMEQVTQGEMMGLTTEVVGAMKILALCGVGCLALLVVLKLFGKRSLIYRN